MDTNANLFAALSMEKMVMFVILSLIILVAVINLISMLMMLVTDKQADIAILRTLGATPRSIMGMFMVQGVLVGVVGIGFGVGLGSLLSWKLPGIIKWIEHTFNVTFPVAGRLLHQRGAQPSAMARRALGHLAHVYLLAARHALSGLARLAHAAGAGAAL
jgi:ABC-type lipoprotein release transport system permease subunit